MSAETKPMDVLAQEIRRVDGSHSLGAGALAEALMPFIEREFIDRAAVAEMIGEAMPVEAGALVCVRFRGFGGSGIVQESPLSAGRYRWAHEGGVWDIMAYRVVDGGGA